MASTPWPVRGQTASGLKSPLHPAPGASGEFGSHAIRPRSGHHMQVMTVFLTDGFSIVIPAQAGIQRLWFVLLAALPSGA